MYYMTPNISLTVWFHVPSQLFRTQSVYITPKIYHKLGCPYQIYQPFVY